VRIVAPDGTVQLRAVTMGPRVGPRWVVERGLQPGDRVIVDAGQLADGVKVTTTPFVEAAAAPAASPTAPAPSAAAAPPAPNAAAGRR
jgi:hypothetical protein